MHLVAGAVAVNACFVAAGLGVLVLLGRRPRVGDVPLAFLAGTAVVLVAACVIATQGYVARIPLFVVFSLLPVAAAFAVVRCRPAWIGRPAAGGASRLAVRPMLVPLVFACAIAIFGGILLLASSVRPLSEWDAWAMWTMKAKALVEFGNLPKADFVSYAHVDYPILVPMLQSLFFRFVGGFDTQLVHVEYALVVLAFVLAIWRYVSPLIGSAAGGAWALYALLLPGLQANVPEALGDVPVAVFAALAAFAFGCWLLHWSRTWLPLFVVFGSAAIWSKNEGLSAVMTIAVVGTALSVRRPLRRHLVPPLVASAVVYATFLPWVRWRHQEKITGDRNLVTLFHPVALWHDRARAGQAFHDLWGQLSSFDVWLALPYLTLALCVVALVRGRNRRLAAFALLVPTIQLATYVVVYAVATDPLGLEWLLGTSSSRVVTTVGLIAVALLPLQLTSLLDAPAASAAEPVEEAVAAAR